MPAWLSLPESDRVAWLVEHGQPKFREKQIRKWILQKRADSFAAMTDLPQKLREELAANFVVLSSHVALHKKASDGTEKLLVELADGKRIECVLLRDGDRRTICISSQVGCAMGCVFCASGLSGVERNLSTEEIVEEALHLQRLLPDDERLSHIVVMGMGEPLANLDRLLPALDVASSPDGLGISARRITISTVGLPAAMRRLVERGSRYHLAVSLHAPNDEIRDRLVPVNDKIGMDAVLTEADRYYEESGRRLTFEYVLLGGLNDAPEHAEELARRLRGKTALVNVIPYNAVAGLPYKTPSGNSIHRFCRILTDAGINVQVRERKGDEIDAACGQLRREQEKALVSLEASDLP